jgi:hypothetical protein
MASEHPVIDDPIVVDREGLGDFIISAGQSANKRGDFVPSFAGDDQLTVLDLVRVQIQICRSSIHDYRESGGARRSVDATGFKLNRLGCNTSAVEFLSNVTNDFKPAQLE